MHKFHIGQFVTLTSHRLISAATGDYEVVAMLPDSGHGPQYRIKNAREAHARMAYELDLTSVSPQP